MTDGKLAETIVAEFPIFQYDGDDVKLSLHFFESTPLQSNIGGSKFVKLVNVPDSNDEV